MLLSCYLRKGFVYIPTVGKVDKGPYRYIDPVAVVPVSDASALRQAFSDIAARGNPSIPDLKREDHPDPVIVKYAGVRTYSAFVKGALSWTIEEKEGIYRIIAQKKLPRSGWVDDPNRTVVLPPDSTRGEMIDRLIRVIQAAVT